MKKFLTVAALAAALGAGLPAQAADKTATILVPTVAQGTEANCLPGPTCEKVVVSRQARCAYTANAAAAQDGTTGKLGYTVAVAGGRPFTLRPSSGTADFDITFYDNLGTCTERVGARGIEVGENSSPTGTDRTDAYGASHFGNEAGTVPPAAKFAIITLWGSANATFVYNES